jgi:hypothetical protein
MSYIVTISESELISAMILLNTPTEYRHWMLQQLLHDCPAGEGSLAFASQEIDDFIFDVRPESYPCVGFMTQIADEPSICQPLFIYKEQVFVWAHQMGFGFDS